jgi:hypothetical protein
VNEKKKFMKRSQVLLPRKQRIKYSFPVGFLRRKKKVLFFKEEKKNKDGVPSTIVSFVKKR